MPDTSSDRELLGQAAAAREARGAAVAGAATGAAAQTPTAELVRQLATETSLLVRQEMELARAELTSKARHAGIGVGGLGAAGLLAIFALAAAATAAIAALALVLPVWAAALIVAGLLAVGSASAGALGARQLREGTPPVPEQTVETLKEDVEWARTRIRSARR